MKTYFLLFLLLFQSIIKCHAQIITVVDKEDQNPVADVAIVNESNTKFVYTNRSGQADISTFSDIENICFQHFTYERICLIRSEIIRKELSVFLTRKFFAFEDFVISANRWEQKKNEVPNRITLVRKPEIQLQNPQTSADRIGLSGEVFIQKCQLGGGSPMIRGFATNRVLIVVDRVRMNNAIYREGNIQNIISLDPFSIESTEIIFGPGATVYGSDAIGGVMDFHTGAPNLDDVGKIFDPAPGIVVVPNPDLEPEYVYNADIGITKDISGFLHIDMTAFFTFLNNAMGRHDFLFNGEDSIMYKGELFKVQAIFIGDCSSRKKLHYVTASDYLTNF